MARLATATGYCRLMVTLFVLCGLRSASALRKAAVDRGAASTVDCPAEVALAGKDQCVDVETNVFVSMECCRLIQDCRSDLVDLHFQYIMQVSELVQGCALSQEDLSSIAEGGMERFDKSKACVSSCQATMAALPPPPDFGSVKHQCDEILTLRDTQMLESVEAQKAIVAGFLESAAACTAEQPPAQPQQPFVDPQQQLAQAVLNPREPIVCVMGKQAQCPRGFKLVSRERCSRKAVLPFSPIPVKVALFRLDSVKCEKRKR